ncbi:MAG: hypothetical protein MUD08_06870 [Cytophagales bacterium]|jgi:tetratricopeptide (TPR) repeat protein|nr:hypothetical protein [Cytophagales bacterium]
MEPNINEQARWERIDAYLRHELTGNEQAAFEAEMRQNTALAEEVHSIRTAGEMARQYGQREELRSLHRKLTAHRQTAATDRNQGLRFYLRVAAIIVFLVVAWAGIGFTTLSPGSLHSDSFVAYLPETTRGPEAAKGPATVEQAMQAEYTKANYTRVAELYQKSRTKRLNEAFVAGNAFLALGQPDKAAACFKRVMSLSVRERNFDFYQDAEYYLAWAYLKNNQIDNAAKLFDKIYRNEFHTHNPDVGTWFYWKLKLLQWKKK